MEQRDRLAADNDRRDAVAVQNLRHGGYLDEFPASQQIDPANDIDTLGAAGAQVADLRAIIRIGHHAAMLRMHPRGDGGSIDFRGTDVGRMMIAKENAILGQAIEHRAILGRNKIWPHSVPDDNHDMLRHPFGGNSGRVQSDPKTANAKIQDHPGRERTFHLQEKMPEESGNSRTKTTS